MHAVQNDKLSRKITAYLFDGAEPFVPPNNALAIIRYRKPDGTEGLYDTLEDNTTPAVTWSGNTATIWLAEQAITAAGNVITQLQFYTQTERLTTFTFIINVQQNAVTDDEIESTDYFSVLTQRIEAILGAVVHPPTINSSNHWVLYDPDTQQYYDSGVDATGIQGETGPAGASMSSLSWISGTHAPGSLDRYQVNLSDGNTGGTFDVYNGADGQGSPGSSTPLMNGTASAGTANAYSREDHIHPKDTSKADAAKVIDDVIQVTLEDVSSSNLSFSVTGVTADHELIQDGSAYLSNPSAAGSDLTITTGSGTITVSGTLTGTTDIVMTLGIITNKETA
jgi:hypothetical protein